MSYSSNRLRLLYRLPWAVGVFCLASVEAVALYRRHGSRMDGARWVQRQARRLLRILGMSHTTFGTPPAAGEVVCNHISYTDILVTSASVPCVFVSKKEVKSFFWLGPLADIAGTIFIDRARSSQHAAEEVGKVLGEGALVAFFPEGTTSDGAQVRRFRAALFAPAVEQGRAVTPAAICYELPGGDPAVEIAFTGEQTMVPHLLHLLSLRGACATLRFGEPFTPAPEAGTQAVRNAANRAQHLVAGMLGVKAEEQAAEIPA